MKYWRKLKNPKNKKKKILKIKSQNLKKIMHINVKELEI